MKTSWFPPGFSPEQLAALVGLLSDTHLPQRRRSLPPTLSSIFAGVDLIFHAGDVGELSVLDKLSSIAPVVAVHGNDDTSEAQRELPERQVLALASRRLLLWHSHDPDRGRELALREGDDWAPKLARIRERARSAGATIAVFGHMHVPLQRLDDGILLVNPGALASGNPYTRQQRQTVALLFLRKDGVAAVRHVALSAPEEAFVEEVDWPAGFSKALAAASETILTPGLAAFVSNLTRKQFVDPGAIERVYYRLARRCWEGDQDVITPSDLLVSLSSDPGVVAADRDRVRAMLDE